jgi:putative ABC transport system permease protein
VRLALGATRARLVRQSIVESALLTWIGLVLGIAVAVAMVETLHGLEPPGIPRLDAVRLDGPVLLFGCVAAALTTMIVGMLPPFHPVQAAEALRIGGSAATARSSGQRARRVLVTIEVALSVVLLVGAVLLGRSLYRLLQTDVGVVTDQVLTASLSLDLDRELSGVQQTALVNRILNQFQMVPGTAAVGVGTSLPPNASRLILTLSRTNSAGEPVSYRATAIASTPGYFSALRIPLLRGRLFTDADDTTHPPVVIMSAATARRFFGDGDPVGRTMSLPTLRDGVKGTVEATLVGIIGDVRYSGLDRVPDDAVYRPFAQQPWPSVYLVARTTGDPSLLLRSLTDYIAAVDRGISVSAVNTLDDVVAESAGQPRFRTVALAGLAGLALMLAAVGLYGVVGYSVSQRTCEMGIRMAIGATSTDIVRMIMSEGMRLAISGVAIGLGAGYVLARFLAGFLYGIASSDVASFALACLIPLLFALITTYIPARRATRIDPSVALRAE